MAVKSKNKKIKNAAEKPTVKPTGKTYYRIFQQDKDGQMILDELAALFYDRQSYIKGDPHETSFREGQRSTIAFIIRKCGLIDENQEGNINDES